MIWARAALAAASLAAMCAAAGADEKFEPVRIPDNPYPSTYKPLPSSPTLIRNATIYDGTGRTLSGDLLIEKGRIEAIGPGLKAPKGAVEIDAKGRFVTPGIIDIHSHLGVYPSPGVNAHDDGNEATKPVTPDVWAEHSIWPQDPGFSRALAGGVTALQVLPGSANLFGGRSVTLKNVPARTIQGMKFPDAPYGLKMACGENPKRVYGQKSGPATRMGNMAGYRAAWIRAVDYRKQWDDYTKKAEAFAKDGGKEGKDGKKAEPPKAPDRKLDMDTLADVLRGKISIQMHCYRADEMALIVDMSKEFGYKVSTFHHAVESYKIADILAREQICSAMWADWWGFKLEAWDTVRENIPMVHKAGACAIVHSDSSTGIQRLNQEAAKALADGARAGIAIDKGTAWTWVSLNPAKAMGIDKETGSLEKGKAADVVIWSRDPFSVYARADQVFVDGAMLYDRFDPKKQPVSDFELGYDAPVRKREGQP